MALPDVSRLSRCVSLSLPLRSFLSRSLIIHRLLCFCPSRRIIENVSVIRLDSAVPISKMTCSLQDKDSLGPALSATPSLLFLLFTIFGRLVEIRNTLGGPFLARLLAVTYVDATSI